MSLTLDQDELCPSKHTRPSLRPPQPHKAAAVASSCLPVCNRHTHSTPTRACVTGYYTISFGLVFEASQSMAPTLRHKACCNARSRGREGEERNETQNGRGDGGSPRPVLWLSLAEDLGLGSSASRCWAVCQAFRFGLRHNWGDSRG